MKLLIIGGTIFVGRRIVEAAVARGHRVTIFTRGRHSSDFHPRVDKLHGDRNLDVSALEGRSWDAVIDTCGYVPSGVTRVMSALDRDRVGHYTFVSSISVYAEFLSTGVDERSAVTTITPEQLRQAEEVTAEARATASTYGELYGGLKVLCERAAEEALPGRALNVRPGLIVGAHDYTDRFTYWVRRVAQGGKVLAPGRPQRRIRVIDARDLADWILDMAEQRVAGVFNATGAEDSLTMERMLEVCRRVSGSSAQFEWIDEKLLIDSGVQAWSELPLWIPETHNGIFETRNDRAVAAGLRFRDLAETVEDILQWDRTRPQEVPLKAGLTREREQELFSATHSSH